MGPVHWLHGIRVVGLVRSLLVDGRSTLVLANHRHHVGRQDGGYRSRPLLDETGADAEPWCAT